MKKLLLTLLVLAMAWQANAQVGQLLGWQLSNPNANDNTANEALIASTWNHVGVKTSALSRGPGLKFSSLTRGFSSAAKVYTVPITRNVAYTDGFYYEFTVEANSGYTFSLDAIDYRIRRSAAGATNYRWAYAINNGTFSDIGFVDADIDGIDDGISYVGAAAPTADDGNVQPIIDLKGIAQLQNLTSSSKVTLRLYMWGISSSGGSTALGRYAATNFTPSLAVRGQAIHANISTLLAWNFNVANSGNPTLGTETSVSATSVNANLSTSTLTRNGFGNSSLPRGLSSVGTLGTSKVENEYFSFDLVGNNASKFISLKSLEARLRRTSGGATTYSWSYSKNGGAYMPLVGPVALTVADEGYVQPTIDLSSISDFQNMPGNTSLNFKLHAWGFSTAAGSFAIGRGYEDQNQNSLEVMGQVTDQPLPVSLTSFTAKANKQGSVNLAWSTASEKDNSHFEVTRSVNGVDFEKLDEVKGNGNSEVVRNYSYIDAKPVVGTNYYRLKQVDTDGKFAFSGIATAKVGLGNDNVLVSVNANKTAISVTYTALSNGKALFNVYSISGAKIATLEQAVSAGVNQISIPVSLSNSIHVLNVSQAGATVSTKF